MADLIFSWIFLNFIWIFSYVHEYSGFHEISEISCFLNKFRTFNGPKKKLTKKNLEFWKYNFSRKCGFLKFLRFINCFRKDSKMIKFWGLFFLVPDRVKINHCITWSEKNYLYHVITWPFSSRFLYQMGHVTIWHVTSHDLRYPTNHNWSLYQEQK